METDTDPVEAGHQELRLLVGDVIECEFIMTRLTKTFAHKIHSVQSTRQNTRGQYQTNYRQSHIPFL
jgi:hypothetical protein